TLVDVLEEMAKNMAFRLGGLKGLEKAILAESVNTAELNSGLQISGVIAEAIKDASGAVAYLRLQGPSQLCYGDKELPGHNKEYHAHGFGTPVGFLKNKPEQCPSTFSESDWSTLNVVPGKST